MESPDKKRFWILACGEQCGGEPVKVSGGKAVAVFFRVKVRIGMCIGLCIPFE